MKRFLALALCAFVAFQAEARTLYVDATRPNNNGNGFKASTAKKTIQAAINVAKKGDAIIVLPGTYSSIATNNKKIAIKAKAGSAKTKITGRPGKYSTKKYPSSLGECGGYTLFGAGAAIAKLGRETKSSQQLLVTKGEGGSFKYFTITVRSAALTKGTATKLTGFTLDGKGADCGAYRDGVLIRKSAPSKRQKDLAYAVAGVSGGTVSSCVLENCGNAPIAVNSKFIASKILGNGTGGGYSGPGCGIESSTFSRCVFHGNRFEKTSSANPYSNAVNANYVGGVNGSKFFNCLFASNAKTPFASCTFGNCTVADNSGFTMKLSKAYNTIFHKVSSSQFKKAKKNALKICYKGSDPKFVPGDYRLKKGSPCIDRGKLTKALKKLVGKKDLAGKKRVKGKAIDLGCYEY